MTLLQTFHEGWVATAGDAELLLSKAPRVAEVSEFQDLGTLVSLLTPFCRSNAHRAGCLRYDLRDEQIDKDLCWLRQRQIWKGYNPIIGCASGAKWTHFNSRGSEEACDQRRNDRHSEAGCGTGAGRLNRMNLDPAMMGGSHFAELVLKLMSRASLPAEQY